MLGPTKLTDQSYPVVMLWGSSDAPALVFGEADLAPDALELARLLVLCPARLGEGDEEGGRRVGAGHSSRRSLPLGYSCNGKSER